MSRFMNVIVCIFLLATMKAYANAQGRRRGARGMRRMRTAEPTTTADTEVGTDTTTAEETTTTTTTTAAIVGRRRGRNTVGPAITIQAPGTTEGPILTDATATEVAENTAEEPASTASTETEATGGACSTADLEQDILLVADSISDRIAQDADLIPGFVRAAFHDCIMATPNNPTSGCNGSLRLAAELRNNNNNGLAAPIRELENVIDGTCVSMADAIQLASAVAVRIAGGPDVIAQVVSAATPRVDAATPDNVNELPNRRFSYAQQERYYTEKGFTVTDMVASVAGGHSLGSTGNRGRTFTPDENEISPNFAWNLVQRADGANGNANGFDTLWSDTALITDDGALDLLRTYSVCAPAGPVCAAGVTSGLGALNADFARFLIKLSRVNGVTVGNSAFLSAGL